jgi:putative DNA primase/helicase
MAEKVDGAVIVETTVEEATHSVKPRVTAPTSPNHAAARAAVNDLVERISEGEQIDALARDEDLRKIAADTGVNLGPVRDYFDGELKKVVVPVRREAVDGDSALPVVPKDPEPAANPEPLAITLDSIVKVVLARVYCSIHAAHAVALWIVASWGLFPPADPAGGPDLFPLLGISSPAKRCGKTTLLETISYLVRRALTAADLTEAALFRTIDKYCPTLLIDEFDRLIRKKSYRRILVTA